MNGLDIRKLTILAATLLAQWKLQSYTQGRYMRNIACS